MVIRGHVQLICLISGAFLGLAIVSSATPAGADTLVDAMAKAYATNPQLLAEQAKLRATDEGVAQALSGWRPTITATYSNGEQKQVSDATFPQNQYRQPQTGNVTIQQPLFRGGRTTAGTRQAENNVLAERARLALAEEQVLLTVVTAYMNVVQAQSVLDLNRNNEDRLRRQLQAARDRFAAGEITRTDVSQAEAALSGAIADRTQAEGDLATARTAYRNVVGEEPGQLSAPPELTELPPDLDSVVSAAIAANPNVLAANYAERASHDNISVVRGALLPTLNLNGTVQRENDTLSTPDRWRDTYTMLLQLQIPIYEAGAIYAQLRAAYETDRQNQQLLDQSRRDARQSATTAWDAWQTARARIASLTAQIQSSDIALQGVQQEALVGSRTVLDILDAEQALLNSQVNLVRSQHDAMIAAYQVRSAVGTLTASALSLPVSLYDPTKNYREVRTKWIGVGKE
jgi:outer membrane protein